MAEPFLGEIMIFGGNFPPRGWAACEGQLLSISQNTALFSLLGTTYGGDGRVTFGLPDLRARVPIHQGQGPGLSDRGLGEQLGSDTVTLMTPEMPAHVHSASGGPEDGSSSSPATAILGTTPAAYSDSSNATAPAGSVSVAGGGQPHENRQPYLTLNYVIALEGIFPSRS